MRGIASVVLMFVGACSSTSTIHRVRGPAYEAEIVSSDATSLHVSGDDGQIYEIPRAEVREVDHPGNVVFVVGAALVALGAVSAVSILNDSTSSGPADRYAARAVAIVYGLPGVLMMAAGGSTYFISRTNARAFDTATFPIPSRPTKERFRPQFPPPLAAPPAPAPWDSGSAVPPAAPGAAPTNRPQVLPAPPAEPPQILPAPPAEPPQVLPAPPAGPPR